MATEEHVYIPWCQFSMLFSATNAQLVSKEGKGS